METPEQTMKIPVPLFEVIRRIARAEERTQRAVLERALRLYSPKLAADLKREVKA